MEPNKRYTFAYTWYPTEQDIPAEELELLRTAARARNDAYAPYSDFLVGAAVELEDGTVVTGNNQENAAFPSSLCAERVAIYHASATHPDKRILRVAICGGRRGHRNDQPVAPCGACRQAILEYAQRQGTPIEILFAGTEPAPAIKVSDIAELVPFYFGNEDLKR